MFPTSHNSLSFSFRPSLRTELMVAQSNKQSRAAEARKRAATSTATMLPYDVPTLFFHKFASCFNQLQAPMTRAGGASAGRKPLNLFSHGQLEAAFAVVKRLLDKPLLATLDAAAADVFAAGSAGQRFPYKSVSETLTLTLVSMMRELLRNANGKIRLLNG